MCMPDGWGKQFHVAEDAMVSGSSAWAEVVDQLEQEFPWMIKLDSREKGEAVRDFSRGMP